MESYSAYVVPAYLISIAVLALITLHTVRRHLVIKAKVSTESEDNG